MAANIDRAYLMVTLKEPETHLAFIDRFLVSAESFRIPVTLLFNKIDLFNENEQKYADALCFMYEQIGYTCRQISTKQSETTKFLKEEIQGKQVMISGHSGAGKSSLINVLDSNLNIRIGEISKAHSQGQHTTTFAEMHALESGGYIIDTPGIRAFGIVDMEKEVISHYFPEMRELMHKCKFNNCQHINEPQCAVKEALEEDRLDESRYFTYLQLMGEDQDENYRKNIYG